MTIIGNKRFSIFQLEHSLRAQGIEISSDISNGEPERQILVQQNIELRRKLEEENQNYKRKLVNYQQGQQKQAQLVQKLQQKVRHSILWNSNDSFFSFR